MVPRRDDSLVSRSDLVSAIRNNADGVLLLQSESSARIVNTLLTELDGLESRKQVFVIGATNRPDILDPAMVRPGRLDKLLYVDLPSPAERAEVLKALAKKTPLADDVDLDKIAFDQRCDGLSGADLSALVREAAVAALREMFTSIDLDGPPLAAPVSVEDGGPGLAKVEMRHFETAVSRANPSVSMQQRRRFEVLRKKFAGQPVGHAKDGAVEQEEKESKERKDKKEAEERAGGGGAAVENMD